MTEHYARLSSDKQKAIAEWYALAKEQPRVTKRMLLESQWGQRFFIEQRFSTFVSFEPCTITRNEDESFVFKRYDGVHIGQDGASNAGMAVNAKELPSATGASLLVCLPTLIAVFASLSQ